MTAKADPLARARAAVEALEKALGVEGDLDETMRKHETPLDVIERTVADIDFRLARIEGRDE